MKNQFEAAGRAEKVAKLAPVMIDSLRKFGSELNSKNVGTVLRGLAQEVWSGTAIRAGIRPPSDATIEAVVLAVEAVYEQSEERATEFDLWPPFTCEGQ